MDRSKVAALLCTAALTACGREASQSRSEVTAPVLVAAEVAAPSNPSLQSPSEQSGEAQVSAAADDDGFANRVVKDLRERGGISEADFVSAHPNARCFSPIENGRVCEIQRPPPDLCPGGVTCSRVDFGFKDSKLRSVRITLSEQEFTRAYRETNEALGEPEVKRHPVAGVCSSLETANYETRDARLQFEFAHCGALARAYGQQQAIIVSLKG